LPRIHTWSWYSITYHASFPGPQAFVCRN
jgi:hypothetical protein